MKKRIKEIVDSNGKSKFIPQHTFLCLFWVSYERMIAPICSVEITFDTYSECKDWIIYEKKASVILHEV